MPKSIDDAIQTATRRITAIDSDLAKLGDQRGELGLDTQLGILGADAKFAALSDKVAALRQERDDLEATIAAASRRQADEAKRAADAEKARAQKQDAKLTAERAAVYDDIADVVKEFAQLTRKAVDLDRLIDIARQQADPATREDPRRQSVARIRDVENFVMCENGFFRDWEWPHPSRRVKNPNEWQ